MSHPVEVSDLYRHVIEDVIRNVAVDFANFGIDEHVLNELQSNWESRLMDTHVLAPPQTGIHAPVYRSQRPTNKVGFY